MVIATTVQVDASLVGHKRQRTQLVEREVRPAHLKHLATHARIEHDRLRRHFPGTGEALDCRHRDGYAVERLGQARTVADIAAHHVNALPIEISSVPGHASRREPLHPCRRGL